MPLLNQIDARTIDIRKAEHKVIIDSEIRQAIDDDRLMHEKHLHTWDSYEKYLEEKEIPANMSTDAEALLTKDPSQILKDEDDNYYLHINKTREINGRTVAEFTQGNKTVNVDPDRPQFTKIAGITKKVLEDIESEKDIYVTVREACVQGMVDLGIHWSEVDFDPRNDESDMGDIIFEEVSARDVLVDCKSRKTFFADRRRDCRMIKMELSEAQRYLSRFGIKPEEISTDNEYDEYHQLIKDNDITTDRFVTLYMFQYKKKYSVNFEHNDFGISMSNYSVDDEGKIKRQSSGESINIEKDKEYFFRTIYNSTLGTVFHKINELGQFTRTPYYNKHSKTGFMPIADTYFLKRLNKLYDIINSVFLAYVRKMMKNPIAIDEGTWSQYQEVIDQALATGESFPLKKDGKLEQANFIKDIPPAFLQLIQTTYKALQDAGFSHDPIEGRYPDKREFSGTAIDLLQVQALKPQGYKERHITYAVTQETRLIYKIMSLYFTTARWIKVQDTNSDKKNFIPVNTTYTYDQYIEYLETNKLSMEVFEEENDVNYVIAPPRNTYEPFTQESAVSNNLLLVINPLGDDADMKVSIKYDFDSKRNKELTLQRTQVARKEGLMPDDDYLKALGFENVHEMIRKVEEKNEIIQVGKTIVEGGPELVQAVMMFVKKFQMVQELKNQNKAAPFGAKRQGNQVLAA